MNAINSSSHSNSSFMIENSNRFNGINIIQSNRPRQQLNSLRRAYIAGLRPDRINHAPAINPSSPSGLSLPSPVSRSEVQRWFTGGELQNLSAQPLRSLHGAKNISRLPTIWESPEEG